jgi:hypothetical protein
MWEVFLQTSEMFLVQEARVKQAPKNKQELGLFHMFIAKSLLKVMTPWCNKH